MTALLVCAETGALEYGGDPVSIDGTQALGCKSWVALTPQITLESVGITPTDIGTAAVVLAGALIGVWLTSVVVGAGLGLLQRAFIASEDV